MDFFKIKLSQSVRLSFVMEWGGGKIPEDIQSSRRLTC